MTSFYCQKNPDTNYILPGSFVAGEISSVRKQIYTIIIIITSFMYVYNQRFTMITLMS